MMTADQSARDDAIVLAALPGTLWSIIAKVTGAMPWEDAAQKHAAPMHRTLRRLKRANLARYVRETKRWEKVK